MALDRYGRHIHYLRISLTDHCNLRCVYCMPKDIVFRPTAELLQDDEIIKLVSVFASLGFDKIRLTGGEPTLRPHIVEIVREIAGTPGIRCLSMTTNGVNFANLAAPLAEAGLERVNFSLDTLDPEKFRRLTHRDSLDDVWAGIHAAEQAGLGPIKINAVVMRDVNDTDMVDLARLTLEHDWQVRFIEMMPFAGATEFQVMQGIQEAEIKTWIEAALGPLTPLNGGQLDGEARLFKLPAARGTLGFISTVSKPFCASCTRARLTADGFLRLCLLNEKEVDILTPLRQGASEFELQSLIIQAIWGKPWGHQLAQQVIPLNRSMSQIGG